MKYLALLLLLLFFCPHKSASQSRYTEQGGNSFLIETSGYANSVWGGAGVQVGYSLGGRYDFAMGMEYYRTRERGFDQFENLLIAPQLRGFIFKQGENRPLSLAMDLGYNWWFISNPVLDEAGITTQGQNVRFGPTLINEFQTYGKLLVQVDASMQFLIGDLRLSRSAEVSTDTPLNSLIYQFGVSLIWPIADTQKLIVRPKYQRLNYESDLYMLTVSMLLPSF